MPFSLSDWIIRKKIHAEVRLSGRPVQVHRVVNPYHAVSIAHEAGRCRKAAELEGRRFLAAAAPKLPLPNCDANACRCRYVHFEDRRSDEDRREVTQGPHVHYTGQNRRLGPGRRVSD